MMNAFAPHAVALMLIVGASTARAAIDFEPTWKAPDYESARAAVLRWREQDDVQLTDKAAQGVTTLWPRNAPADLDAAELLDRLANTFALAYPEAANLVQHCEAPFKGPAVPEADWLTTAELPDFVRNNLRLYYARWLAQYRLYDEVLSQIDRLQPDDVVDPASLLFYRMAAHHQLVQPEEARASLVRLLEREDELPRRFQQVAQLVQKDLAGLEDESLDHIARRMRDVRRRLNHGRAGEKVQAVERSVLDSLDKKIEDLEKKQQQCQQAAAAASGGGSSESQKPMEDSLPAELKAPMQVDRKDIGNKSGWGDLPPKEREQALQQIGREYPAHYRELIEEYFRELAAEEPAANSK